MFYEDFKYPVVNDLQLIENNYLECSKRVKKLASKFYSPFDEDKFVSLLK